MYEPDESFEDQQAALDAADAISEKFEEEFKSIERFEITGSGLGHLSPIPVVRVYVVSDVAKQLLTEELKRRDNSRDYLFFEGARIEIVVTGRIELIQKSLPIASRAAAVKIELLPSLQEVASRVMKSPEQRKGVLMSEVTEKDIFETVMAIRMVFGQRNDEFRLEQTKTSVLMIVPTKKSAKEALPYIQETLDKYKCKAPVEVVVALKTLTAKSAESEPTEDSAPSESAPAPQPVQNKISDGLRSYLDQAVIPGDKGVDVQVHVAQPMTADEVSAKLEALFGPQGARLNSRTPTPNGAWVACVKRGLIRRFNEADWVTQVKKFYGDVRAYDANDAE